MKIEKKIEEINEAVNGTLTIIHYYDWELHSYKKGSLFSYPENYIYSTSFKELIEKAYKMFKGRRTDERKK